MNTNGSDFLVVGSGIAGLLAAIKLSRSGSVTLVTKKKRSDSNTNYAQGGIAVPVGEQDSVALHIEDTLTAGCGLGHREVVEFVVKHGKPCLEELIEMGVTFTADEDTGRTGLALGREGGHTASRIVHSRDHTGREIETVLLDKVRTIPGITLLENHIAVDLILESKRRGCKVTPDRCWGAYVMDVIEGSIELFLARVTILASGGAGKVYLYTSNPDIATGDGIAMAYRAGARCANLEFVQFHPTCLYHPRAKSFLISEAVRGEGAILRTLEGEAFMEGYDPRGELAPRDVVARAVDSEMKRKGDKHVLLDLSAIDGTRIRKRFPNIYRTCLDFGIDITRQPIPVVPAAHYMCGGVVTDLAARTDIEGLLCAGEVAATGLHGANRLASNSLLEALVFASVSASTAAGIRDEIGSQLPRIEPWQDEGTAELEEVVFLDHDWDQVRTLMWDYVGIVRSDQRLKIAKKRIRLLREQIETYYWNYRLTPDLVELRNIALVGELIIRCAMMRRESRGLHYNIDCPDTDDSTWKRDTLL
ncbi:MAG: L-aspartate oxidase [Candidatus Eisenbacteria bacterium]